MYHGYKNKGGGYWKGRSRLGKNYTSQYPPMKYWGGSSKSSSEGNGFVAFLVVVIIVLFFVFLFIIAK